MKTLFVLTLFFISSFIFIACEKDVSVNNYNSTCDTIRIRDTVRIYDTIRIRDTVALPQPTLIQSLTAKWYRLDEMVRSDGGSVTEYNLGGVNNTGVSYQNMRFKFNADFTGTYIDENNGSHTLDWGFTNAAQTKVFLTIGPPYANTFNWRIMDTKNNFLYSTSVYNNSLIAHRWIQVP